MTGEVAVIDIVQLVSQHYQSVYRYAFRLTGSATDAEDLTQQVFLVAQRKLGQLRNADHARAWLFAILRHALARAFKRKQPVLAGNLEINLDNIPAEPPEASEIDSRHLQDVVASLPEPYRLVVVMFYFEELSYKEIAAQLELPIGTVMSRLARGKSHLRDKLFGEKHESGQHHPHSNERHPRRAER
jgi:RNA polymerase sigma-70 factor (ECF subfamily)